MDEVEKLSSTAGSDAQLDFAKDESHLFYLKRPVKSEKDRYIKH